MFYYITCYSTNLFRCTSYSCICSVVVINFYISSFISYCIIPIRTISCCNLVCVCISFSNSTINFCNSWIVCWFNSCIICRNSYFFYNIIIRNYYIFSTCFSYSITCFILKWRSCLKVWLNNICFYNITCNSFSYWWFTIFSCNSSISPSMFCISSFISDSIYSMCIISFSGCVLVRICSTTETTWCRCRIKISWPIIRYCIFIISYCFSFNCNSSSWTCTYYNFFIFCIF